MRPSRRSLTPPLQHHPKLLMINPPKPTPSPPTAAACRYPSWPELCGSTSSIKCFRFSSATKFMPAPKASRTTVGPVPRHRPLTPPSCSTTLSVCSTFLQGRPGSRGTRALTSAGGRQGYKANAVDISSGLPVHLHLTDITAGSAARSCSAGRAARRRERWQRDTGTGRDM